MRSRVSPAIEPDVYVPFTATMPKRLIAAIDERAVSLGLSRAAYLVSLACCLVFMIASAPGSGVATRNADGRSF